eukprot:m51a1_g8816 putative tkl protein kinase (1224) ;mRNA; f:311221-315676
MQPTALAAPLLLLLLLLCTASAATATASDELCGNGTAEVVVGLSVGPSLMERSAADGFREALAEAAAITKVPLRLVELNHSDEKGLRDNVELLVGGYCAFLVVGRPGDSATEPAVLRYLRQHRVPLVGFLSGSEALRDVAGSTAMFRRGEEDVRLPLVVNVRGTVGDEVNDILSMLSRDWSLFTRVAMVADDTPLGRRALEYTHKALAIFNGLGLLSRCLLGRNVTSADLAEAERVVFKSEKGKPAAVIVCTSPGTTVEYVRWLAQSGHAGVTLYLLSLSSALDLGRALAGDAETRELLVAKRISLLFTQTMPFPTPARADLARSTSLLKRFNKLRLPYKSHSALEGYLTGWFIYEVAQKAAAKNGLPLTRADFLATVFIDTREFSVQGVTLGPYGDGGISGALADTQSAGDACNQGVHEVFMARLDPATATEQPVPGGSLRFGWCMTPRWYKRAAVTVVGAIEDPRSAGDMVAHTGLLAAVQSYGSQNNGTVLVRSVAAGSFESAVQELNESKTVVLVSPRLARLADAEQLSRLVVVSPTPGFWGLRGLKNVVSLFPSSFDEVQAAIEFFALQKKTSFAVLRNDASSYTDECALRFAHQREESGYGFTVVEGLVDAHSYVRQHGRDFDGFVILGGQFDTSRVEGVPAMRLLGSQVVVVHNQTGLQSETWGSTFRLSVTPPSSLFASTSPLRTDYAKWVSLQDTSEASFTSFFVGKFLTQVIDKARRTHTDKALEPADIVEAVYEHSVFFIEDIRIGPFKNMSTASSARECCNQGLNAVYVLRGPSGNSVEWTYDMGNCGKRYIPLQIFNATGHRGRKPALGIGLSVGLGGAFVICAVIASVAVWRSTRIQFFNIRRGELELGSCMGQGRFGSMYMADWHGTAVAVRVIDKKATPKEDQRLIKEEVLLLHKHHHPNLLMLMGYCETRNEIFVVTEFMEGGTLSDYLARGKPFVQTYSLISMAFIDGQGTVKVSDLWYGNKRGVLSSSGSSSKALSRAAWQPPEVIAGTTLTPATDVYAFGIVLWELIAPPDMTMSSASATSGTPSAANSSSTAAPAPASAAATPGMASITVAGVAEMSQSQIRQTPEIPPNVPSEVADLLERCWYTQPERRPSVFQILRNWPTTFASLGKFEVPQDLDPPSLVSAELPAQPSRQQGLCAFIEESRNDNARDLNDEMVVSMASFMPVNADSDALQMPQPAEAGLLALPGQRGTGGPDAYASIST